MTKKSRPKKPDPVADADAEAAIDAAEAHDLAADVAAAAADEPPADVESREQLLADIEEAQDRVLRSRAELENYRKRAARELQDVRRYANLPLMRDLLPVLDNLDRAIEAAEKNHDTAKLLEGVKIVAEQFEGVLQRHHCTPIETLHQPFDPHLHEAISQQPCDEHPSGTVVLVTQSGFQLHDRVVRPSQVIVSTPGQEKTEEQST